jgi:hypothetical protein
VVLYTKKYFLVLISVRGSVRLEGLCKLKNAITSLGTFFLTCNKTNIVVVVVKYNGNRNFNEILILITMDYTSEVTYYIFYKYI